MKNMSLSDIAIACKSKDISIKGIENKEVTSVVIDSRQVEKGSLFIATVGEKVDGHSFIVDVIKKGALAVICEKKPEDESIPYILVKDSFLALKEIATYYRSMLTIPIVAVVGSVGKTSTKEMITSVLSQKYNVLKTLGNYNNEIGLPLTILRIRSEHEVAVLELGINQFGEMTRLGKMAIPDYVVMTNIADCHLEYLGDRSGVLKAKSEILPFMNKDGLVILNGDDAQLLKIKNNNLYNNKSFGFGKDNDLTACDVKMQGLLGSKCRLLTSKEEIEVRINIPGEHQIKNAMAATLVALELKLTCEEIKRGIESANTIAGRSNIIKTSDYILIDDCYNANPTSMKVAIDLLESSDTRKVAILGDMGELGDNKELLHQEVGNYISDKKIDVCIGIGKLSRYLIEGIKDKTVENKDLYYFESLEDFLAEYKSIIKKGDAILIKASHFMKFDLILNELSE